MNTFSDWKGSIFGMTLTAANTKAAVLIKTISLALLTYFKRSGSMEQLIPCYRVEYGSATGYFINR